MLVYDNIVICMASFTQMDENISNFHFLFLDFLKMSSNFAAHLDDNTAINHILEVST